MHPFYQFTTNEDGTEKFKTCMMHTLPDSLTELFKNPMVFVNQLEEKDRVNVVYSLNHVSKKHDAYKRVFESSDAIAFDIDGDFDKDLGAYKSRPDYGRIEEYIEVICSVLQIDRHKTVFVKSGVGIHVIISVRKNSREDFFTRYKECYLAVCHKLQQSLELRGLSGKVDKGIFDKARVLRLPGTWNVKPDKGVRALVELVTSNLEPQLDFDLRKISGLEIKSNEFYEVNAKRKSPAEKEQSDLVEVNIVDQKSLNVDAIEKGCGFLRHAKENSRTLSELEWKASISILARLDETGDKCHEYSKDYAGYSHAETEKARQRALAVRGAYRCTTIKNKVGFEECLDCPHFGKVMSPLFIVGEGDIKTAAHGFSSHDGKKLTYNVVDLIKYFQKKYIYKNLGRVCHIYNPELGFYERKSKDFYKQFAQDHFRPEPQTDLYENQFSNKICITNEVQESFFIETVVGKTNFKNGYYDFNTHKFMPHSPDVGFLTASQVEYDEKATCPTYDKMIKKISCYDEKLETLLDQIGGYAVSGCDYWEQKCFILVGEGSNGKTTWMNILNDILGDEKVSCLSIKDFSDEKKLYGLSKSYLNVSDEMPPFKNLHTDEMKKITGGGKVYARNLYAEGFNFYNKAKLFFACNKLPQTQDNSHGYERRVVILPFNASFSRQDEDYNPFIKQQLRQELAGIFNRLVKGYKFLQEKKELIVEVESVLKAKEEMKEVNAAYNIEDFAVKWVKTRLVLEPRLAVDSEKDKSQEKYIKVSEVWAQFKREAEEEGFTCRFTGKYLGHVIRKHRPDVRERYWEKKINGSVFGVYYSVSLGWQEEWKPATNINFDLKKENNYLDDMH